jgi:hypothetical protein
VVLVIVATGNHFFLDITADRTQLGDRVDCHNGCLVLGRG